MTKKPKSIEKPANLKEPPVESSTAPEDGIGSRIRAAREARGFSQTNLAEHSKDVDTARKGVSRTVLVGYESGQFKPGAREIRILSEALLVTPNWLIYGSDFAGGTEQASMEAVRKNGLYAAMRLALAISILKTHERNAFSSLVLSMAGRELGDQKLSALFALAARLAQPGVDELSKDLADEGLMDKEIGQVLLAMMDKYGRGIEIQYGNKLQFSETGLGPIKGEWLYPEPKK